MEWLKLAWFAVVVGVIVLAVIVPAARRGWAEGREQQRIKRGAKPQVKAWSTPRRKP